MQVSNYIEYFRQIAIKNKTIAHNPDAESKNGPKGECAFTVFNMDAVARSLRTAMKPTPCLHLHIYDNLFNGKAPALKSNFSAGFLITRKVKMNNNQDEIAAYAECEKVVYEILAAMQHDYTEDGSCGALGAVDLSRVKITATGPLWDNRFGWWVEFDFPNSIGKYISEDVYQSAFNQ